MKNFMILITTIIVNANIRERFQLVSWQIFILYPTLKTDMLNLLYRLLSERWLPWQGGWRLVNLPQKYIINNTMLNTLP